MQIDPRIKELAQAIASAEGFGIPGSIPTLAHNPGDLVVPGWVGEVLGEGVSVFDSDNSGWQHLYHQIGRIAVGSSHVYSLDMTIEQMAARWTETQVEAWAQNVASFLSVPVTTTLRELLT
jgi:hypothetical protein